MTIAANPTTSTASRRSAEAGNASRADRRCHEEAGQGPEVVVEVELVLGVVRGERIVECRRQREEHPDGCEEREAARGHDEQQQSAQAVSDEIAESVERMRDGPDERVSDRVSTLAREPPPEGLVGAAGGVDDCGRNDEPRGRSQCEQPPDPPESLEHEDDPEHHIREGDIFFQAEREQGGDGEPHIPTLDGREHG